MNNKSSMNIKAQWSIIIGAGIPALLVLIGLIALVTKFIVNRCRKRPWSDIKTLPKPSDLSVKNKNYRKFPKRSSSERQLLCQSATNDASDGQISIPIDENDIPHDQQQFKETKQHEQTLLEVQHNRLNHIKQEENRIRPMIDKSKGEDRIQRTIEQVQKEFEESLSTAAEKLIGGQDK